MHVGGKRERFDTQAAFLAQPADRLAEVRVRRHELRLVDSAGELSSHAHQPQLVKMPRATGRHDVLALRHHDAPALKFGDCAAQRRRLHVVDHGFELGA